MGECIIRQVRKNGRNQLFITIKEGENDINVGDYVIIKKINPEHILKGE